jgi:hypothetical protein
VTEAQRNEEVRLAILAFLAPRQAIAAGEDVILDRVPKTGRLGFAPTREEMLSALAFLQSLDLVRKVRERLGSSLYYQATSAGVLAHERGTLEE